MRTLLALGAVSCLLANPAAQTAQTPALSTAGPVFDVVSIKPSAPLQPGTFPTPQNIQRPDGGFTMTRVTAVLLIMRAHPIPDLGVDDIVGLPDWARREAFDVSATSTLTRATSEDRTAMMKAMLTDRFKLAVHVEPRPRQLFELVLARGDRRLGPGLTPVDTDCAAYWAAWRAADEAAMNEGRPRLIERPDITKPHPCTPRLRTGRPGSRAGSASAAPSTRIEGETAMAEFVTLLRLPARRQVVDKTGLSGSYRVAMEFDMLSSMRGPDVAAAPDSAPDIFTAIQEQLGLKLRPAAVVMDTLVIDRLERPTEN
jgi:uncharacterized protein (TIGR03435 family)